MIKKLAYLAPFALLIGCGGGPAPSSEYQSQIIGRWGGNYTAQGSSPLVGTLNIEAKALTLVTGKFDGIAKGEGLPGEMEGFITTNGRVELTAGEERLVANISYQSGGRLLVSGDYFYLGKRHTFFSELRYLGPPAEN
jgi:hypothetical protein